MELLRLYHTARYLRARQLFAQVQYRVLRRMEVPGRMLTRRVPSFPECGWTPVGGWVAPGARKHHPDEIVSGRMSFVNQERAIGWLPDWEPANLPKLWVYNLHYFEWLWAFASEQSDSSGGAREEWEHAKSAISDWIETCVPKRTSVAWEPYPTALRLMNWCACLFGRGRAHAMADRRFVHLVWASLWRQTEWLSTHLEYHLMGNHLLEEVAALAFVGSCFRGPDSERWRKHGLDVLRWQLREQVLADGMHFELSPMYHSRIVYLLLTLFNTGNRESQDAVGPFLAPMLTALARTLHPDGQIALLNDSAFGIYLGPQELSDYGVSLGVWDPGAAGQSGNWSLPQAGLYGHRGTNGSYVICDCGLLGPDYIPGHAHADLLSFELSLNGQRVIVDSGVRDYEWSESRRFCRSTRAHNTVEVGGRDQAEMWGAFRVARRGYPREVQWQPGEDGFLLAAHHDGYRRLPGHPVHHRSFDFRSAGRLRVTDCVRTSESVACRSFVHLHPDCHCVRQGEVAVRVQYRGGEFTVHFSGPGKLELLDGTYHPEFHVTTPNTVLTYSWTASSALNEAEFVIGWHP